jgi:4-hydroxybenzoate polyprenyltransferase
MPSFLILCAVVVAMLAAIQQMRDDRRKGVAMAWPKMFATLGGLVLILLIAAASLVIGVKFGSDEIGITLFIIVLVVGMTFVIVTINRRWPPVRQS